MRRKDKLPLTGLPVPSSIKTSISMPGVLMEFAERETHGLGFSSTSAYLQELVRRRKELDLLDTRAARVPTAVSDRVESESRKLLELSRKKAK